MKKMLKEMFDLQVDFQSRVCDFPVFNIQKEHIDYIRSQTLACIDELMEALHNTPWKPWKKNQKFDREKFKEELVDVWHFLINLTLASGMGPTSLYQRFIKKNKENNKRQDEGY